MQATKTNKKTIARSLQSVMKTKGLDITSDQALSCVTTVFQALANGIARDGEVRIDSFGYFSVRSISEHKGFNPHTHQQTVIPAHKTLAFKAALCLRNKVNEQ